jgi:hypothetical protein
MSDDKVIPPVTIFTVPKPFRGHIDTIQRNAISSWMKLRPTVDIMLLGSDEDLAGVASELNLRYLTGIKCNQFGTPLLNSIMGTAEEHSLSEWLMLINCDIILTSHFLKFVTKLAHLPKGLYVGLRSDLDVTAKLDMSDPRWEEKLIQRVKRDGRYRGAGDDSFNGTDYYIYPRGLYKSIPPFAIGRYFWDSWLNAYVRRQDLPLVDISAAVMAIHQNHDYSHVKSANSLDMYRFWTNPEAKRNFQLIGGFSDLLGPREASHKLIGDDLVPTGNSLAKVRRANRRYYLPIALRASWFFRMPMMATLWNYLFPFDAATGRHAYSRWGLLCWLTWEIFRPLWRLLPQETRTAAHIICRELRNLRQRVTLQRPASNDPEISHAPSPSPFGPVCAWFHKHLPASSSKRTIAPAELKGRIASAFGYGILNANKRWHVVDLNIHHVILKREDISSISIEKLTTIYEGFDTVYRDKNYAIMSRSNVMKHIECDEWPEVRARLVDRSFESIADILVILNVWKRGPDLLRRKIRSTLDQTEPASEIWVCAFGVATPETYSSVIEEFTDANVHFFHSTKNLQTSGRYQLALGAETTYVAFIDDDIIIGRDFLRQSRIAIENLKDAGEVGIYAWRRLPGPGDTPQGPYAGAEPYKMEDSRVVPSAELGEWASHLPPERTDYGPIEVDLLCGYHFLRTAHVKYLFREQPWTFIASDDIQLAFALRKFAGMKSYLVPIDPDNPESWGLSPDWLSLGREQATTVGDMLPIRDMLYWRLMNRGHPVTWMGEERGKGVRYLFAAFSSPEEASTLYNVMRETLRFDESLRVIALYCGVDREKAARSVDAFGLSPDDQVSHAWSWLDLELGLEADGPGSNRTRATNAIYGIGALIDALKPDSIWLVADADPILHSTVRIVCIERDIKIIAVPFHSIGGSVSEGA